MSDDDEAELLLANEAFYRAFNARDMVAMDDLWARARPVACIHPGWPPLFGRDRVMASWRQVLGSPASPRVRCLEPKAHVLGSAAFVVCFEAVQGGRLVATNVFVREDDAWHLSHHQAGPVASGAVDDDDDEPVDPRVLN